MHLRHPGPAPADAAGRAAVPGGLAPLPGRDPPARGSRAPLAARGGTPLNSSRGRPQFCTLVSSHFFRDFSINFQILQFFNMQNSLFFATIFMNFPGEFHELLRFFIFRTIQH